MRLKNIGNGEEEFQKKVEIVVRTIGPAPPSRLHVPSPIRVHDLRKLIAENGHLPIEKLRIILGGNVLHDSKSGHDVYLQLSDGDSLIVAVKPKAPVKHIKDGFDDDDDDEDLKFQLPQSSSQWKRTLYSFLHDKLKLPGRHQAEFLLSTKRTQCTDRKLFCVSLIDILLMAIFSLSVKMWIIIIMWFILAPVAHRWDVGPLYILGTGFGIILLNLGKRQPGDVSAYSIFNEDFRELPGTLNAERLDGDIRTETLTK
ncbi:ubiquitin family protein [Prunus dulcis]|uniref:Ubiquitin family protein n=1 Tax=Prunus dulcis TaxID=3755 RepID=A0A4Y1RG92_PRUDU|nr:ubiquitin family protein [Prunus dulcis]